MTHRLYFFSGACFLGVLLSLWGDIGIYDVLVVALLGGACIAYGKIYDFPRVFFVGVLLGACALGGVRGVWETKTLTNATNALQEGHEITLTGHVATEPEIRGTAQRFVLQGDDTRVLVSTLRFPELSYGAVVSVVGKVQIPESFETDTGRVFNYREYLWADRITHTMSFAEVRMHGEYGGNPVRRVLFGIKSRILHGLAEVIPEPHVSLLSGILLGSKEGLGETIEGYFQTTGLVHIVVLSGYNVSIVADAIMRLFAFLPNVLSVSGGAIGIVLFVLMAGSGASIVRAGIMALILLIARATGRLYGAPRALAVAALLMVLHRPYILLFDPSFQLSVLATLGLMLLVPYFEKRFRMVPRVLSLRTHIAATLATQIFVLPLLLFQTGTLSIVSVVANALVLPLIPITMLCGGVVGALSVLSPLIALVPGFIETILLGYVLGIARFFAELPFAAITIPAFPVWIVVLLYGCYGIVIWKRRRTIPQPLSN